MILREVAEWLTISTDFRIKHRGEAIIYEDSIARALLRIRKRCDTALHRARITMLRHSADSVDRARDDLFMGLTIAATRPLDDTLLAAGAGPFGTVFAPLSVGSVTEANPAPQIAIETNDQSSEDAPETLSLVRRWKRDDD